MDHQDHSSNSAEALRRLAEENALKAGSRLPIRQEVLSLGETQGLLHELHVHQIQLEMQNEELRRVQEDLAAERLRYFDLYDLAPVGYCMLSREGLVLEANLTIVNLLGLTRAGLLKQPLSRFIFHEDQDAYYLHRKKFLETGEAYACDLRMLKKDGSVFWANLTSAATRDSSLHQASLPVIRMVVSDITERKRAEDEKASLADQLQQAQKLETIGILAGGVAHDFNNLLTTILGNANLGTLSVEPDSKVAPFFVAIEKASLRAAALTRQLLAYAGKGQHVLAEVDLGIVVKEVVQLLSVSIPKLVSLRCDFADCLPSIKGDGSQIFQILMNLITNASEAFGEGERGLISIKTRAESIDDGAVASGGWVLPLNPGRYVTVEVVDTGMGMAAEVLAQIFDPFFTTKFTGRGLGLAAVIGILGRHGGTLSVRSQPGQGSTFKLFLPATEGVWSASASTIQPVWRGEGQFLVVDDEAEVRGIARKMAECLGFSVLEAQDGLQALDLFRLHHGKLAIVLLDLDMPRMGGWEAFREMRNIDSSVPLVLSSGHGVSDEGIIDKGWAGILRKPYLFNDFQLAIQQILICSGVER